jgi:hypothetical protein
MVKLKGLLKNPEKECASLLARFLARIKYLGFNGVQI